MSNIPTNAISSALNSIQRTTGDAQRARKMQAAQNLHHAEDVQELDDTAVDSIRDEGQGRHNQQEPDEQDPPSQSEDTVDIKTLDPGTQSPLPIKLHPELQLPHLDISA